MRMKYVLKWFFQNISAHVDTISDGRVGGLSLHPMIMKSRAHDTSINI